MLYFWTFLSATTGFNLEMNGNADANMVMMNSNAHINVAVNKSCINGSDAQKVPFSNFHCAVKSASLVCVISCGSFKADKNEISPSMFIYILAWKHEVFKWCNSSKPVNLSSKIIMPGICASKHHQSSSLDLKHSSQSRNCGVQPVARPKILSKVMFWTNRPWKALLDCGTAFIVQVCI